MRITMIRTGGFTGIPIKKTIDTEALPNEKAKEVEAIVTQSQFFSLQNMTSKSQPDRFSYTLTVQKEEVSHSVTIHESILTPELQKLISYLDEV